MSLANINLSIFSASDQQFFTKLADEIASARLIFPWVLGLLGAPLLLVSLAVPIRESGVLLPQLFIAARIRAKALRKYVWMLGGCSVASRFGLVHLYC